MYVKECFYLAGGFYGDWRQRVIEGCELSRDEYMSPETDNDQRAAQTFVRDDLACIDKSTAVLACLSVGHHQRGTAGEIGYAYATGKPVLLIIEEEVPDMFLIALAQRMFVSVDAFIHWYKTRRIRGLPVVSRAQSPAGD